ncbi:conserved hypothetical protein [Candidatus Nitrotoga sp. HW29]|uniref:hypothetical protein n=1 Tax=Candidatus Nitrotoga sp. HW29 TaxID=2886963 RepID=UPI001EF1BA05|nr:hypothetical protein [Candidatus Nitrotoga sp. HW29]CAH1906104.1 conserved hypothetical protein [Candidatus Nitrotoga sp. HW29]
MSNCFAFRFSESNGNKRKSLAIFFSSYVSPDSAVKIIKADIEENLAPLNVYILAVGADAGEFIGFSQVSFQDEFISFVGDANEKLKFLCITTDGRIEDATSSQCVAEELKQRILNAGMIEIFKKRKGLITSSSSYHFVKPSGDHCDKFIRASNLLTSGEEVAFLAISLLPHIQQGIKRIYVDTSSISYLISTAILMSGKFSTKPPLIESFESYAAFNQDFDFIENEDSLILVSATTSGSLVKKLLDKTTFNNRQILTLFYSKLLDGQAGVFDISYAIPGGITSLKATDCIFCKRGSKQIRIVSDQFLPETPKHELLVIKKTDFDKERGIFFKHFATREVLNWNRSSTGQADYPEHFFIDVAKVLSKPPESFSAALEKKIKKHVSRDVKTIIHLNDSGSEALADKLKAVLGNDANQIDWLKLTQVDEGPLKDSASVIVIAGAITSGRKLLEASRKLRCIHKSASITYLVGFSKLPTKETFEQLEKDLELGGHELVVLRKCPMPRIKEHTKTAWDWELEKLNQCADPLTNMNGEPLPKILSARIKTIEVSNSDPNQLFLLSPVGHILKLRRTFAFWSDLELETDIATQADVYWTIQSVLHDLRIRSDERGLASTYHTTLISPACFDRYNDGVIQASLLRAAKPTELNYTVDADFSRRMTDVVLAVLHSWNNDQGEAALEFLIAIWTGRMELVDEHLKEIIYVDKKHMPEEMRFIIEQLKAGR